MIEFRIGGRKVRPNDIGDALERAMLEAIKDDLHKKLGSLRDPETGDAPVVIVTGPDLHRISIKVEGSDALIAAAKERLGMGDEEGQSEAVERGGAPTPQAFICHGSEDKDIVRRLATDLRSSGIDGFFDEWEIRGGDSLRQKIDEGLERCTHFLVVLSRVSLAKPWVNAEMDAGYAKRLRGEARFIPLRLGIEPEEMPPLLQGIHSPSIEPYEPGLAQLVSDIHGLTSRPPLGAPPPQISSALGSLGLSPAAEAVVKLFIQTSEHGDYNDPIVDGEALLASTGLSQDDLVDAVDELEGQDYVRKHTFLGSGSLGFSQLSPTGALFGEFDSGFMEWSPKDDGLVLVTRLLDRGGEWLEVAETAEELGWEPRRMNPAIHYLDRRRVVKRHREMGTHPWTCALVQGGPETRRYARSQRS